MRSHARFLIASALIEVGAGLALVCLPALAMLLVLGVRAPSPEALIIGRLGGAGLFALGIACWLARDDAGSRSQRGLLCGMLIYNVGACLILGAAGLVLEMSGIALWPAVLLHAAMTVWCVAQLRASAGNA